ncbi:MAG TPA: tetratricopeptide repeat protein [Burkholderiaceae bacterium]
MTEPTTPAAPAAILSAMRQALAYHQAGQLAEAEPHYREVLRLDPRHGDANHNLGLLLLATGRQAQGLERLEHAAAAAPSNEQYALSCSGAWMDAMRPDKAAQVLDRAFAAGLESAALLCNRGNAARMQNLAAEAEANFRAALAHDTRHALTHYNLGCLLADSGREEEARQCFHHALAGAPEFAAAHRQLGLLARRSGSIGEAIDSVARSLALAPADAEGFDILGALLEDAGRLDEAAQCRRQALALGASTPARHHSLGRVLQQLGRFEEAAGHLRQAVELDPQYADAWNDLGTVQRNLGLPEAALHSFSEAAARRPDFALALSNLGNALLEQGRPGEAETACRRALAANGDLYEAHLNLGNALLAQHDPAAAASSYRNALLRRPEAAEAHFNLGNALLEIEELDEAQASYRRAIEFQPDMAEAHNGLGNALKLAGQLGAATACYRLALQYRPQFAEALVNLGMALQHQDDAEAEACCLQALQWNPRLPQALVFLADLRSEQGRVDEAEGLLRQALALSPGMAAAWAGLAGLRKMSSADAPWADEAHKLLARRLPARQEVYLQYAVGKYHDDVGEYDKAFDHYRRANLLDQGLMPPYDRQAEEAAVDRLIAAHDARFVATHHVGASPSERPVFVLGLPRSGTSLAEQIIAAHPQATGAGELPFWSQAAVALEPLGTGRLDEALVSLPQQYLDLIEKRTPGALRTVDKMPANFQCLGLIHAAFPEARIIHMRRHPIDTCLSIYFQHFNDAHRYANDLDNLAHYYRQYSRIMAHWRAVIPRDRLLEVRYEDLVADQERWSRAMIDFIGLPWDPACLEFHRVERSVGTASKWQVRQKIHGSSVERWRRYERFVGPLLPLAQEYP